eukprot:s3539_g9.t2
MVQSAAHPYGIPSEVLQFQTGDEREYPVGFCHEYAKAALEILGDTGSFVEVFSGPNAPLSVSVGAAINSPVPGSKLAHNGKGDKVELQHLSQLVSSHPLQGEPSVVPGEFNPPEMAQMRSHGHAPARSVSAQEAFYRRAAIGSARQPGYGKRVQLIPDGLQDPIRHIHEALKLEHPFNDEHALKPEHQQALEQMAKFETQALQDRMKVLGEWRALAASSEIETLQNTHESLACSCAVKLGRKPRTALMETLGSRYGIEDPAVPKLCLTGMPIVGKALESPFFHPYHVPAAITVAELLKTSPLRRASTLRRVKLMAQSGGDDMAQAIWKKTLKEVAAGTMAGPFTLERHGKYLNLVPSFGLKQGDKYRRIDDHSASHNNLAAERTQQIQMAMVDYLMTMVSSMGKSFRGSLVIGTEDMAGAYRQVPLTDSQISISVTAVYNPELEQTQLFEIYGQPFGAAHAVPNFYRVAEWACRLMVRAYHVMIDHFFDDYFAVLRDLEAESTMFCIREAFRLIGLVLDPEKSQPPSDFAMVLGVAFNTKSLREQKLLLVEPKPTRVSNLCALVDRIIQEGSLAPSLAASLLGKFGFLCSTLFGKVGRCCTGAIRARQYGHPDETALTPSILTSLHLIKLFAKTAPRREMSLGEADPPLILYTDASDVPGRPEGQWVQGVPGAGASLRRAVPGFFGDADAFGAEAFDGFAEVAETPEAAPAKAKSVAAKPKAKTLTKAPAVTKAKAPGARPKAAERPASPASVPSSPARSTNSRTNSPAGRPRPGSLGSFSESIRAAQAGSGSPNQAKARAVSPNQAKARAASPASQAKARAASPASQAVPKRSAGSRSTTPKASPRSSTAVAKVPPARIASKAAPKARPKSGASLEVPEATSRSPSPRSRSPTRPTSRSPTFPRSPSDSRPSSPSKPGSPSPRRTGLASPKSPPARSPPRSPRTSPKSPPLTRPGSTPRTVPQRRTILSPSSSEGSPLKERQLYREVERKQKELDELKRRLEEEQVKAEKREDEVSSLQRRRQNTWEWQLDQQRNEWLPMLVEDERGRLLHQVSLALAQTRSSLSNGRVQVRKSLDQMQMENQELQSQVGQLENELQHERGVSAELRHVTEELKQKVVKIEKESAHISADALRLQEQEEVTSQRSPLEEALQELQDTLQGERQKLLDAHEKMKTFQQEAAQNRIQLQESRKRFEDLELETKRNMEEKELDLRTARAEGRSAALAERRRQELEEDLMELRNETKGLQRAAQDNQRLLLRSSFETWHSRCLQVLLQRSEELGQNSQEGLGRQLAAQEEKEVKVLLEGFQTVVPDGVVLCQAWGISAGVAAEPLDATLRRLQQLPARQLRRLDLHTLPEFLQRNLNFLRSLPTELRIHQWFRYVYGHEDPSED